MSSTERDVQSAMRDRMKARYELMASTTAPTGRTFTVNTPTSEDHGNYLHQMQQGMYPHIQQLADGVPVAQMPPAGHHHQQHQHHHQQPPVVGPAQPTMFNNGGNPHYFQDPFACNRPPSAIPAMMNASNIAGSLPPPPPQRTAPNTSVVSYDRCRSLKDRIHDRLGRRTPSPAAANQPAPCRPAPVRYAASSPSHQQALPTTGEEPTKDIYYHERPFPVASVLEVERMTGLPLRPITHENGAMPTRVRDDSSKEVLLMASECAAIVNDLKQRLAATEADNADLRDQLDGKTVLLSVAEEKVANLTRDKDNDAVRLAGLQDDLVRAQASFREELDRERGAAEHSRAAMAHDLEGQHTNVAEGLRRALHQSDNAVNELQGDKRRLEELNGELRDQLSNNARSVESNVECVDRLTKELVLAKQQTSFISVGYKRQEAELARLRGMTQSDASELQRLSGLEATHSRLFADHEQLKAILDSQREVVETAPQVREELTTLRERSSRLEATLVSRDERIQELKELVDQIRSQASAAYQHARGFNIEAAQHNPSTEADNQGTRRGGNDVELTQLMEEVRREERRADEERQRWRERMDSR